MTPKFTLRRASAYRISAIFIFIISGLLALNSEPSTRSDPDRFYHYAVSEQTAKDFAPDTIPQIEGLAWNKIFPEKEFLFHVFTGLGYKAAGEKGVLLVCMLIGTFIVFSIYLVNTQSLSPFLALIPTLLLTLASSKFLIRIFAVRPQILGVLFAILLVGALLQRRQRLAGFFSMLFALSYHAVYIPIALAAVACIATFAVERDLKTEYFRNTMKCLISTVAGIIIGLLINPYFPSNIMMGIQHLKIALLSAGLPMSHFGVELQSVSGSSLLNAISPLAIN